MNIKLAEALLRRKELQEKVNLLRTIKDKDLFEAKVAWQPVTEGVDHIIASVPKLNAGQVTREFDWHARQLRMIDAAIQQANWTTEISVEDSVMHDYMEPPTD
jgi:hypothetical protein